MNPGRDGETVLDRTKKPALDALPERPTEPTGKRDSHNCRWGENMPRPRIGVVPMTPAQRQARRRARLRREHHTPPAPLARRTPPRPKRWAAAVAALIDLQDEYRAWRDNLPASLAGSRLAEKLHAITELDLEELQAIEPPRGYGRD
jgi:hypothetical protein